MLSLVIQKVDINSSCDLALRKVSRARKLITEVFSNFSCLREEMETNEEVHANFNVILLCQTQVCRDFKFREFLKSHACTSANTIHI